MRFNLFGGKKEENNPNNNDVEKLKDQFYNWLDEQKEPTNSSIVPSSGHSEIDLDSISDDDLEFLTNNFEERLKEIDMDYSNGGLNYNTYQKEDLHDDLQILDYYIEYDKNNQAQYLMFNLRVKEETETEWMEMWKAVKLLRLTAIPRMFREEETLLSTWDDVLIGMHDSDVNFITLMANILKPERIGLVYCYGVQAVAETPEEAQRKADNAYAGLAQSLMANFTQIEYRLLNRMEANWIDRQMREMKHLLMLRGIPKPRKSAGLGTTNNMGGTSSNTNSEEQNEEFLRGMSETEYLLLLLTSPVSFQDLHTWLNITSKELGKYKSEMAGTRGLSAGISIPVVFMGNLGAAFGKNVGESNTFGHAIGLSHTDSTGLSHTTGLSESATSSHSEGVSDSVSVSQGNSATTSFSESQGLSYSEGKSYTEGVSRTDGISQSDGTSHTVGGSYTFGLTDGVSATHSTGASSTVSQGISQGVSESEGISYNKGLGHSYGISDSIGYSSSVSSSQSTGTSENWSHGISNGVSESSSHSTSNSQGVSDGVSTGSSYNQSHGQSFSTGTSESVGLSSSVGLSNSVGNSHVMGNSQTQSTSQSHGTSESVGNSNSWGTSESQSSSWSNSHGTSSSVSSSSGGSYSESNSVSDGISNSVSNGTSQSYSHSVGSSESVSSGTSSSVNFGHNISGSASSSYNEGNSSSKGYSQGTGTSEGTTINFSGGLFGIGASYSTNDGSSTSESYSSSTGESTSKGISLGNSEGYSEGYSGGISSSHSQGISESVGESRGVSYSQGTSNSHSVSSGVSQGTSWSNGVSNGVSDSASVGGGTSFGTSQSQGTSFTSGVSNSWGTSNANAISENFGVTSSTGTSQSQGTSSSTGTSTSQGTSDSFGTGYSNGTSNSTSLSNGVSVGTSQGTSSSISDSQGFGLSSSVSQGVSNGVSSSHGTSESVSSSESYGLSNSVSNTYGVSSSESLGLSESWAEGATKSQSNSYGTSISDGTSQSFGISQSLGQSLSEGSSASHGTSASVGKTTANGVTVGQSQGMGQSVTDSIGLSKGTTTSDGISTSKATGQTDSETTSFAMTSGMSNTQSMGSSSSMGLGPSLSYTKSAQWYDENKANLVNILDEQRNRLMTAIQQGAFYVDVYILTPDEKAKKAAGILASSSWYGDVFPTPVHVVEPDPAWAEHLMEHASVFSACTRAEDAIELMEGYKFSTILLPEEMSAYCHPPRFEGGDMITVHEAIPFFHLPGKMEGEAFLGYCISTETGVVTNIEYRLSKKHMMHTLITGASGSGKTVTSLRFISELVNKMGFGATILDWKDDWRSLMYVVPEEKFSFYSLGTTPVNLLQFNPIAIPKGVDVDLWMDSFVEAFTLGFGLGQRGYEILWRNLGQLYSNNDVWNQPQRSLNLTMLDLYNQIEKEITEKGQKKQAGFGDVEAYNRVLARMGYFTNPSSRLYKMFGNPEQPVPVEELCAPGKVIVLEAQGLKGPQKSFLLGLISAGIFQVARVLDGEGKKPFVEQPHMIVFEEAHQVVKGADSASGDSSTGVTEESTYEVMWNEARSAGLYMVALAQMPTHLPTSVLANTRIYITHQLGNDEDIDFITRRMIRDPKIEHKDVARFMEKIPLGYAIVQVRRIEKHYNAEPVLAKIEMIEAPRPTDDQLSQHMKRKEIVMAV